MQRRRVKERDISRRAVFSACVMMGSTVLVSGEGVAVERANRWRMEHWVITRGLDLVSELLGLMGGTAAYWA